MTAEVLEPAQALIDAFVDLHAGDAAELLESAPVREVAGFLGKQTEVRSAVLLERLSEHFGAGLVLRLEQNSGVCGSISTSWTGATGWWVCSLCTSCCRPRPKHESPH